MRYRSSLRRRRRSTVRATRSTFARSNGSSPNSAARYEEIERDGVEGFYASKRGEVVIESRLPGNARLRTLLHEAAHALVDRELLDEEERLPYATEEVLVETIGYLVASAVGLDTRGEAVRYVASWSREEAGEIARLAELIDAGARRLENALGVGASADEPALSQAA